MIEDVDRHLNVIRDRIESGEYQALSIRADDAPIGVLVWSVEQEPRGAVVVVNALAGVTPKGHDLTAAALEFLTVSGRMAGAVALRFWTARKGLVAKCERRGMRAQYVVEGTL